MSERTVLRETIPGGAMWSHVLWRHERIRFTDLEGGANVALLLFNRDQLLERYNMPDTLKAQHTAFLTAGNVLYSDMGRILCSIVADESGWHDTVCGVSDAALVRAKYGEHRYQQYRNDYHRNGNDALLVELGKWGLGIRDLVPNANLFSKVTPDAEGGLRFHPEHALAGAAVELRAELNTLLVLCTCQHPLDPNPRYEPKPVELLITRGDPPDADDLCRRSCPENARGFENTERWFGAGGAGAGGAAAGGRS
jgi:uncharacterized protein